MDDPPGMAVLERLGDLDAHVDDAAQTQGRRPDQVAQVVTLDDRHDEEHRPVVAAEVVDRDDRGVVHLGNEPRLALKALLGFGSEQRRCDHLDGHLALEPRIPGAVDHTHASPTQLGDEFVPV